MNKFVLATALALTIGGAAHAVAIDLTPAGTAPTAADQPVRAYLVPNVAVAPGVIAGPIRMSELPEPEVFAMMLVGLLLIGYRAGRDSSETFK